MDEALERHRFVSVRFPEPQWHAPDFPAAVGSQGSGRDWTFLVDATSASWPSDIETLGANILDTRPANLEEIFLARARGKGQ